MELFIQIRGGQPFEHPIMGNNFREAFPNIDVNNLPPEFARFERIECPQLAAVFEMDEVRYEWVDGVVKDIWSVRPMTEEEKTIKLEELTKIALSAHTRLQTIAAEGLSSATTDEQTQAWNVFITELSAWVLIDPVNPNFPSIPIITQDGRVLNTTLPGAEPDVIG
jgi:hypothetical protein